MYTGDWTSTSGPRAIISCENSIILQDSVTQIITRSNLKRRDQKDQSATDIGRSLTQKRGRLMDCFLDPTTEPLMHMVSEICGYSNIILENWTTVGHQMRGLTRNSLIMSL